MSAAVFSVHAPVIGELAFEPLRAGRHAAIVHPWLMSDHARFWAMQWMSLADVEAFYADMAASNDASAWLGRHDGRPAFLMESYDPAADPIGAHYDVRPGDRGMHILVAPAERPVAGFTRAVFAAVMDFLFNDTTVERIVVEPDVDNDRIHVMNRRAGFVYHKRVRLPKKTAALAFCTRAQYLSARSRPAGACL